MTKLKADPITASDLAEWLETESDFAFEQKIHRDLVTRTMFTNAQHKGTYDDPVTGKPREYDIRGTYTARSKWPPRHQYSLYIAIECKNIRSNSPLLVQLVPCAFGDSYNHLIRRKQDTNAKCIVDNCEVICKDGPNSLYPHTSERFVGKNCVQVGRTADKKSEFSATNAGVFDKWAQALSSASDLIAEAKKQCTLRDLQLGLTMCAAVIPFLVVPDEMLWQAKYFMTGQMIPDSITQVSHCCYFVGKEYSQTVQELAPSQSPFRISHIEFCTRTGLTERLNHLTSERFWADSLFSVD